MEKSLGMFHTQEIGNVQNASALKVWVEHLTRVFIIDILWPSDFSSSDSKFPDDIVTCKVPFGGFLLFNNMTPHRRYATQSK